MMQQGSLLLAGASLIFLLSGCSAMNRIENIGEAPPLTQIQNPTLSQGYQPVSMPMPAPSVQHQTANSLWQAGARAFFRDMRAARVGDILTVIINIDDSAELENSSTRTRANTDNMDLNGFLGLEGRFLQRNLPDEVTADNLYDVDSQLSNAGTGQIDREEQIEVKVAAVVTQLLPNGNLVISGRQQVVVNFEMRELQVAGIIRPQDIATENTINFEQIAEARIAYGGQGQITDVQQPRYGSQLMDIILPF